MADRENEQVAGRETGALKKLQALAGVAERGTAERLDWMYEQSSAAKTDLEAMNTAVSASGDKEMADVKSLSAEGGSMGSLFLKGSATRTTEDTLRKLREDPLFQIRREEQAARESMMSNPLIQARLRAKAEKAAKKDKKSSKKEAKKEKKALKKAKKAMKAAKKAGKKSSSSSSDSDAPAAKQVPVIRGSIPSSPPRKRSRSRKKKEEIDLAALAPSTQMVSAREERAARTAEQKKQALASRDMCGKMSEEEKQRRFEQMKADASSHDAHKNKRIAEAERKQKEIDEKEAKDRATSDQKYFREMREQAYLEENGSMESRLKHQRHRRQKGIVDSLEKDDR